MPTHNWRHPRPYCALVPSIEPSVEPSIEVTVHVAHQPRMWFLPCTKHTTPFCGPSMTTCLEYLALHPNAGNAICASPSAPISAALLLDSMCFCFRRFFSVIWMIDVSRPSNLLMFGEESSASPDFGNIFIGRNEPLPGAALNLKNAVLP